jgi:apolipoprotein N-acyltransferase
VLIDQPNIDPFSEKIPYHLKISSASTGNGRSGITSRTDWLICPKLLFDPVNEADAGNDKYVLTLRDFASRNAGLSIIAGLVSYTEYPDAVKAPTKSSRKTNISDFYADHYNSAFMIDTGSHPAIYHKSKLVPGIEMQFSAVLGRLAEKILPDMGGTIWGYGTQPPEHVSQTGNRAMCCSCNLL